MKITRPPDSIQSISRVQEKQDSGGDASGQRQQQHQQQKPKNPYASEKKADPEEVRQAIDQFQTDAKTQANGLQATAVGTGPGLKVVLKDGSGAVVRQFTGEEFLRLREAASQDAGARGKILDQKL